MEATLNYANRVLYSDVDPFEVVRIISDSKLEIRGMDAEETEASREAREKTFVKGGFVGHYDNSVQDWDITSNKSNPVFIIRKHKDGDWYSAGGTRFILRDKPRKHYDFNF